jgi:hypothetical protein
MAKATHKFTRICMPLNPFDSPGVEIMKHFVKIRGNSRINNAETVTDPGV